MLAIICSLCVRGAMYLFSLFILPSGSGKTLRSILPLGVNGKRSKRSIVS